MYKLYYPHEGGMNPYRVRGKVKLFKTKDEPEQLAQQNGWKKYLVVRAD